MRCKCKGIFFIKVMRCKNNGTIFVIKPQASVRCCPDLRRSSVSIIATPSFAVSDERAGRRREEPFQRNALAWRYQSDDGWRPFNGQVAAAALRAQHCEWQRELTHEPCAIRKFRDLCMSEKHIFLKQAIHNPYSPAACLLCFRHL